MAKRYTSTGEIEVRGKLGFTVGRAWKSFWMGFSIAGYVVCVGGMLANLWDEVFWQFWIGGIFFLVMIEVFYRGLRRWNSFL